MCQRPQHKARLALGVAPWLDPSDRGQRSREQWTGDANSIVCLPPRLPRIILGSHTDGSRVGLEEWEGGCGGVNVFPLVWTDVWMGRGGCAEVGKALLLGMALVDWRHPAAQAGRRPAGAQPDPPPAKPRMLGSDDTSLPRRGTKRTRDGSLTSCPCKARLDTKHT